ncbi:GNAT family N-acetyltransferase [Flavobacterium akiainvivens]|uniref:GNAT family N-acetyltransferase n=1 Tax=Flavobacterium akiainvivens TaxID=1202724 RepID=UPI0006C8603D|nr:GNAT family N-acetyltransferase [Flavobacterium akiainvivens]SFQ53775.1 Protein N-acetyltransferase, RimJ/RimL family [Flavobacterium akiainvivens]
MDITIREAKPEDALNLLNLKKSYIEGSVSIPLYIDEYKNGEAEERTLIERYLNEQNSMLLVAEHNGRLIGNLDLTGNQRRKMFHTAMLGMGIAYDWQGKGVGSLLMQAAVNWASKNEHLKIIWLEVYHTNIAGLKLYEKYGFEQCGIMKNFVIEAQPVDKIAMVLYL